MSAKAALAVAVVFLVIAVVMGALYAQASARVAELEQQLSAAQQQLSAAQSEVNKLRAELNKAREEMEKLRAELERMRAEMPKPEERVAAPVARGYMYALVFRKVGEDLPLEEKYKVYIVIIDPTTHEVIAEVPLPDKELMKMLSAVYAARKDLKMRRYAVEVWTPRYFTGPQQKYLYIPFTTENASYVAVLDMKTFETVKIIKTWDGYSRQYTGITVDGRYFVDALRQPSRIRIYDVENDFELVADIQLKGNPCDVAVRYDNKYLAFPVRADRNPEKLDYTVIVEVGTWRVVAEVDSAFRGVEPFMIAWSYHNPRYVVVQGAARPFEGLVEAVPEENVFRVVKEVSYPEGTLPYSYHEHPLVPYGFVVVRGFGVIVRTPPPEYREVKRIDVSQYVDPKTVEMGAFTPDGRFFYLQSGKGIIIIDTRTLEVVKVLEIGPTRWVIAVPSGDYLYATGRLSLAG